jgi:hypothetical protein
MPEVFEGMCLLVACISISILASLLLRLAEATLDVPSFVPGMVHAGNFFDLLAQLDDIAEPGVPEAVFRRLVRKCRRCGDCMSSRVILFHKCKGPKTNVEVEVIDLTNED